MPLSSFSISYSLNIVRHNRDRNFTSSPRSVLIVMKGVIVPISKRKYRRFVFHTDTCTVISASSSRGASWPPTYARRDLCIMDCRRSSSYTSFAAHKKRKIQRARQPQRYFLRLFTVIVLTLISQGRKAKITSKSFALHVVGYYNNPGNTCSGLLSAVARNIPIIANLDLSTYPNQAHDERADPTQRIDAVIERLTRVRSLN